ncbi:EAL domain-containing protein [Sphingomonadaceae bacterium]|nr:EAL domain-containing protein [Sphingomonadaceae bacterium]
MAEKRANREMLADTMSGAKKDVLALAIAAAAILMFIGTGSSVLPTVFRNWVGTGDGTRPDTIVLNALLLNIALIIFGWRRYRELTGELAQHRESENEAKLLAATDSLTGCLNRRSVVPAAEKLLEIARNSNRGAAFFLVDLDNFKKINDLNGHKTGDEILRLCANRMTEILPEGAIIARLGGDEFGIATPYDIHRPDRLDHLAARLIDQVAAPADIGDNVIEVTVSIGIATSHTNDSAVNTVTEQLENGEQPTAEIFMHRADIAMYHAKKQGKNRCSWFEMGMENELRFRNTLETGIREGILNDEFVPFYERQVDLKSGKLTGFEMLARWNSPDLGLVAPDLFIPIAEELGVIAELSERLLAKAFQDALDWHPDLSLSVNISPVQLRDPWFAQKLLRILAENNFPTHRLDVEITESCLHENIGVVRSTITSLRNQGVRISLDDFGTGYSSLAQLRSLPFDRLKIDRSFVGELRDGQVSSKIVESIVALGVGLGLPIVAEGIENDQILATLKKMGNLNGQGYLYGKPLDAKATRAFLEKEGLLLTPSEADELVPKIEIPHEPEKQQNRGAA